jgi:hypothetical protein
LDKETKSYLTDVFNDSMKIWLVIWELGVVIQLPPWIYSALPSSLFIHFNIDIHGSFTKIF